MRTCSLLIAAVFCLSHNVAAEESALPAAAKSSLRYNPIVKAVLKTRNSVVTIRVPRSGGGKDFIGTGVIFDERGYIVTNNHVVAKKATVTVRLSDGTELVGAVWANEARWDLAVVKVTADRPLPALAFAPVDDLMVGETVIAVGHPFGYQNTVSQGIVSAIGREISMPSGDTITGLVQTDASINPGNSGGPLLNIEGELIGINVAIREGAQGIAFAINSGTVQTVLSKHLKSQRVSGIDIALTPVGEPVADASRSTTGAGVGVPTGGGR